jgi:hypothetical protein
MKRMALLLLCAATLAMTAPARASGTDVLLFGFTGFDYEDPDTQPGTYLAVGEGYKVVGHLTSVGTYLEPWVDTSVNEYTMHMFNLTVNGNFFVAPFLTVTFDNNGRGRYYEDDIASGTAATYGTNPPNATSPSTFIDGVMQIGGDIDNFVLVYDYSINDGNFYGDMTLDEGPDLIYIPPGQYAGWVIGGINNHGLGGNPSIPAGYDHQVDGECRIPGKTPTTHTSWGSIKALYR